MVLSWKKYMLSNLKVLKTFIFLIMFSNLKKALYGLKQAPRAWYARLKTFLIENGFNIGKIDTTLSTKRKR